MQQDAQFNLQGTAVILPAFAHPTKQGSQTGMEIEECEVGFPLTMILTGAGLHINNHSQGALLWFLLLSHTGYWAQCLVKESGQLQYLHPAYTLLCPAHTLPTSYSHMFTPLIPQFIHILKSERQQHLAKLIRSPNLQLPSPSWTWQNSTPLLN